VFQLPPRRRHWEAERVDMPVQQKEGVHDQPETPRVPLPDVEGLGHRLEQLHNEGDGVPVGLVLDLLYGLRRRLPLRRRLGPQAQGAEAGVDGRLLHRRLRLDEALAGGDLRLQPGVVRICVSRRNRIRIHADAVYLITEKTLN